MSNVKELLEEKTFKFQIENGFKEALGGMSDSLNILKEYVDSLSEEEIKCLNDKAREYCNEMERTNKYNFKKKGIGKMGRNIEDKKELVNDLEVLKIMEYNNKLVKDRIHLEKDEAVRKDIEEYILQVEKELKRRLDMINSISPKTDIKSELESLNDKWKTIAQGCREETIDNGKVIIYDIDFTKAMLGYTAVYNHVTEEYENRIILDEDKMVEIILQNKDRLDDVENECDAYEYIQYMGTEYWFDDKFIINCDYEPIF